MFYFLNWIWTVAKGHYSQIVYILSYFILTLSLRSGFSVWIGVVNCRRAGERNICQHWMASPSPNESNELVACSPTVYKHIQMNEHLKNIYQTITDIEKGLIGLYPGIFYLIFWGKERSLFCYCVIFELIDNSLHCNTIIFLFKSKCCLCPMLIAPLSSFILRICLIWPTLPFTLVYKIKVTTLL